MGSVFFRIVRRGLLGIGLLGLSGSACSPHRAPYRVDKAVYPTCPGLMPLDVMHPWDDYRQKPSPVCTISFDYAYSAPHQIRLWISAHPEPDGRAWVEARGEDGHVRLLAEDLLSPSLVEWFRDFCGQVLAPLQTGTRDAPLCEERVRDGHRLAVGRFEGGRWLSGETHGVHPDTELDELRRAARALIGALTAPPELRPSYWIELHRLIAATHEQERSSTPLDLCSTDTVRSAQDQDKQGLPSRCR